VEEEDLFEEKNREREGSDKEENNLLKDLQSWRK
jgi:hypothetical protein